MAKKQSPKPTTQQSYNMRIKQQFFRNGEVISRHYCLNCDWLSFSFSFSPEHDIIPPNGYKWVAYPGTNVFKERYILYNEDGCKMMTICCNPYSSALRADVGVCQIANQWLYNPCPEFFVWALQGFKNGRFNGCSRLDIALDFCPTQREYAVIRKLTSGAMYVSGKSQGSLFWHTEKFDNKEYRMAHCMSWGSKASLLTIKLYNKSLEIHAADPAYCTKPYIVEEWGDWLEDKNSVWRLEFSLNDTNQYLFGDTKYTLADAMDGDRLARTYSTIKSKRFIVRMNQGRRHGHKNDDTIINDFVPVDFGSLKIMKAAPVSERIPLDDMRALARQLHAHLTDSCVIMDDWRFVSMRDMLIDYAQYPAVLSYLDRLCGCSFAEWLKNVEERRNDTIVKMDVPAV